MTKVNFNIYLIFGIVEDWHASVEIRERDKHTKGPGSIQGCECLSF